MTRKKMQSPPIRDGKPSSCVSCGKPLHRKSEYYCSANCADEYQRSVGATAPVFLSKWKVRKRKQLEDPLIVLRQKARRKTRELIRSGALRQGVCAYCGTDVSFPQTCAGQKNGHSGGCRRWRAISGRRVDRGERDVVGAAGAGGRQSVSGRRRGFTSSDAGSTVLGRRRMVAQNSQARLNSTRGGRGTRRSCSERAGVVRTARRYSFRCAEVAVDGV